MAERPVAAQHQWSLQGSRSQVWGYVLLMVPDSWTTNSYYQDIPELCCNVPGLILSVRARKSFSEIEYVRGTLSLLLRVVC